MSARKIIILNGHPGSTSLSQSICRSYQEAAEREGHEVRLHELPNMRFDPDFGQGSYENTKSLEPDLTAFQSDLEWADHIVMATPMWWGAIPAKLKGLFDRALLPGVAFDPRNRNSLGLPAPMLNGKTARVFLTSDTPSIWLRLFYANAIKHVISRQILGFVGIKPTKFTAFAPASEAPEGKVKAWLSKAALLGAKAA